MGPLKGLTVIEMAGIGPAPLCGMLLSDMGAQVISIQRRSSDSNEHVEIHERGKQSIALNLKTPQGIEVALRLIETADVLLEGFRPGVMERLGLGPDICLAKNPRLVFARMTGWGQTGPLSQAAGHDINYISLSGALHAIGPKDGKPVIPLNLVGDNGGGALYVAYGIMCAVFESQQSGQGQVVDVSMVEGAASLMTMFYSLMSRDEWKDERGSNFLDGAAPFYNTYETRDGKHISIGPLEPQFYAELIELAELDKQLFGEQYALDKWPDMSAQFEKIFKQKTRDQWCELLEGSDVCFAPILSMKEAPNHPHNKARNSFIEIDGKVQPAPAPKFSRTPAQTPTAPTALGASTESVLKDIGIVEEEINSLREAGVLT